MAATSKGARTRRRIVTCAAEILAERGVTATNLADVVEAAKLTKGALYFHFSSTDELILGIEAEYHADSRRLVDEVARDPNPVARLIRLSFGLARRQLTDPLVLAHSRLLLSRTGPPQLPTPLATVEWPAVLLDWLEQAQAAALLAPGLDLVEASEVLDDCLVGAVTASQVEVRQFGLVDRVAVFWRMLLLPALIPDPAARAELQDLVDEIAAHRVGTDLPVTPAR